MSAQPHHEDPSSETRDIEKNQHHKDFEVDHDHENSSATHSDHDASTIGDDDDEEHDSGDLTHPATQPITREKTRRSEDLRRAGSNVLSAIASRVTTRGWPEPPPPPDGGFQAWLQVACVRIFTL